MSMWMEGGVKRPRTLRVMLNRFREVILCITVDIHILCQLLIFNVNSTGLMNMEML